MTPRLPDPTFPPLLSGVPVRERKDPVLRAARAAMATEAGAGDLFWSRDTDRVALALVLEPDVPRERCQEMMFLMMVAFGDAFGATAPPEVGLHFTWPQGILVNGAQAGRARLRLPPAGEEPPPWLVVGLEVTIRPDERGPEGGEAPDRTTLWDEGCGELDRTRLIESAARHALSWLHRWEEDGFAAIHADWLGRSEEQGKVVMIETAHGRRNGTFLGLDDVGNLLLREGDRTSLVRVDEALEPEAVDIVGAAA